MEALLRRLLGAFNFVQMHVVQDPHLSWAVASWRLLEWLPGFMTKYQVFALNVQTCTVAKSEHAGAKFHESSQQTLWSKQNNSNARLASNLHRSTHCHGKLRPTVEPNLPTFSERQCHWHEIIYRRIAPRTSGTDTSRKFQSLIHQWHIDTIVVLLPVNCAWKVQLKAPSYASCTSLAAIQHTYSEQAWQVCSFRILLMCNLIRTQLL